jgi:hypothetical protein
MRRHLGVPFFMEIIIAMTWNIRKTRNDWIFNDIDPSVHRCRENFIKDFRLLLLRAKPNLIPAMETWITSL